MEDDKKREPADDKPSPVQQVGDRGLVGSNKVSTSDEEPDSALGSETATRSAAAETAPNPAEERSE